MSRLYIDQRERYWDAQKAWRQASVDEARRLMPDGVAGFLFEINDGDVPRLTLCAYLDDDGDERPAYELEESGVYDAVDQIAADVEAFHWEEADSFLIRAEDSTRFVINRA